MATTEVLIPDGDLNAATCGFWIDGGPKGTNYYQRIDESVDDHDSGSTIYNTHNDTADDEWLQLSLPTPVGEIDTSETFTVRVVHTLAWGSSLVMKYHIYEDGSLISTGADLTVDSGVGTYVTYELTGLSAAGITDKTKLELRQEATGSGGQQVRTTAIEVIAPIAGGTNDRLKGQVM